MYAMADLLILNLLWLLCSLPVLTAGPATSSLFAVTLKIARGEPVETIREFFKAFKDNFKQALLLGLIAIAGIIVIYADVTFALEFEGAMKYLYLIVAGIICALLLIFISYSFALNARYENTMKGTVKNAFLLAFVSPGKTLGMWLIYAIPVALLLLLPRYVVAYIGFLFILFGISLPVYINSQTLNKIFDKVSGASGSAGGESQGSDTMEE